jgi:sigma-E factor negative regulatory protein RseB
MSQEMPIFTSSVLRHYSVCALLMAAASCIAPVSAQGSNPTLRDTTAISAEVESLLQKMATVPQTLNYQGSFTYQHKDNPTLQSFRILHWVENGVEHERLQHLNGPAREFVREGKVIGCSTLGNQLLQGKVTQFGANLARLDQLYKFEIRGPERVAGREATALLALPLDQYRHSSLLSIDNETGLVLKSWLVDEAARPLERYQFIDLKLNPDMESLSQPIAKNHRDANAQADCNPNELKQPERWKLAWVPPGFAFAGQRQVQQKIDMLMYTDGLTTFSIFIQQAEGIIPEGVAQRGATLAVMDDLIYQGKTYRITVVGEIPAVTAQKIAQNIEGI